MKKRKEYTAVVTSDKMQKTRIVRVMRLSKHPKYSKIMRQYSKYKIHDEKEVSKVGDTVRIRETRPLSKDKRYKLLKIIKQAALPEIEISEAIK